MKKKTPPEPTDFLACYENYKISKYAWENSQLALKQLLKVETNADLERALLSREIRKSDHWPLCEKYNDLSIAYDGAQHLFSVAKHIQQERIRKNRIEQNYFIPLEC